MIENMQDITKLGYFSRNFAVELPITQNSDLNITFIYKCIYIHILAVPSATRHIIHSQNVALMHFPIFPQNAEQGEKK